MLVCFFAFYHWMFYALFYFPKLFRTKTRSFRRTLTHLWTSIPTISELIHEKNSIFHLPFLKGDPWGQVSKLSSRNLTRQALSLIFIKETWSSKGLKKTHYHRELLQVSELTKKLSSTADLYLALFLGNWIVYHSFYLFPEGKTCLI